MRIAPLAFALAVHAALFGAMWLALRDRALTVTLPHAGVIVGEIEAAPARGSKTATLLKARPKSVVTTDSAAPAEFVANNDSGSKTEPPRQDTAAGNSATATGAPALGPAYLQRLLARIEETKEYPALARRLRQSGRVEVEFTIERDGAIRDARVAEPCAHERLNEAALRLIQELKRVEPLPPEHPDAWRLRLPIEYRLSE